MKNSEVNKVIVVTGANAGIGIETVRGLLGSDVRVVMACRNLEKAESARAHLEKTSGNEVDLMQLDLADMRSIEAFATAFNKKYGRLDVWVNNAGVFCRKRSLTTDGFETTMGVNFYGTVYLTRLLLPTILRTIW